MADRKTQADSDGIAIIGMACLFPGAKDLPRYWRNICNKLDAIREVPTERWRIDDFYCSDGHTRDRVNSKWGGFLDPLIFDPIAWRIPPAALRHIEPVQLLALEIARQALVDAGCDPFGDKQQWREKAGVLFAVSAPHELGAAYCFRTMMRHYLPTVEGLAADVRERIYADLEKELPQWSEDSFPGILSNVVAGRIAREFDLHGPNFTVDAACAASMAALYTAVEQLRAGTSDLMLVGGADGSNNPFGYMSFAQTHALSPRGKCRAFDATGDGIALGEGIACVVLKRLADAERDGDRIYAIVQGIGASSDGKNRSLTAPHPAGQARAIRRAYEDAGISPATVSLIEAHGTGTAVGDRVELSTLMEVFAPHTGAAQSVAVGSVKSMIGHTKTVAGLASVIKTALALHHRVLPPTIGVEQPLPPIDAEKSVLYLNTETRPWIAEEEHPRRAGVSSFGFGGTNFHLLMEEHSASPEPIRTPRAAELFVFERNSREEMIDELRRLRQQFEGLVMDDLAGLAAAVCASIAPSRSRLRLAIVAVSIEDVRQKLGKAIARLSEQAEGNDPSGIYYSDAAPVPESAVCFLYPGQGSQSVNMLRDLVVGCPWSHDLFHEANRLLREELPRPLTRYLYPPPVFDEAERRRQAAELRDTRIAQPALGLVELFATALLDRFGIRPALAAGHSYGEYVALHAAGCLSQSELLQLSAYRGRLCAEAAQACPGAMAAVQADAAAVEDALRGRELHVANLNAPDQTVIAGPSEAIDAAVEHLARRGMRARRIDVSAAFHSPQLAGIAPDMQARLAAAYLRPPQLPVYSNTTGQRHADDPQSIRALLVRHLAEPVLFEKQIRQLHTDGARVFLEVGPGKVLTDLVSRILPREAITALALDAPGRDGWTQLAHVLARLAVLGLPVRLDAWFAGRGLASSSLAEFLARTKAETAPKPTDWIISPNKAEPATTPKLTHNAERNMNNGKIAMNGEPSRNGHAAPPAPANADLVAQFQETTRLLLETQQAQNRVLERFLQLQERILLSGAPVAAKPAAPLPTVPAPSTPRPPVPIPRMTAPTNGQHSPPTAKPATGNGEGPPSTEKFRKDLLDVVSARTGYPVDALDEDLALEAALGIDSIKTVEIFSHLKAYHPYFRAENQEEEELLAEFTQLKTLRDIINAYDRRRQAYLHQPAAPAKESGNGIVKRYTVTAQPAPWEGNGEKKNGSRIDRPCS